MQNYLIKPKNHDILYKEDKIIEYVEYIEYIVSRNGIFLEYNNVSIFENLTSNCNYYMYAPYPLNLLAFAEATKNNVKLINTSKPNFIAITFLLFWLHIEQYLRGSDTHSNIMNKIIARNFENKITEPYFIPIKIWIKKLNELKKGIN